MSFVGYKYGTIWLFSICYLVVEFLQALNANHFLFSWMGRYCFLLRDKQVMEPDSVKRTKMKPKRKRSKKLTHMTAMVIFDRVPLQQLLILGDVSSQWKRWQVEACRMHRHINLYLGDDADKLYRRNMENEQHYAVKYRQFQQDQANVLMDSLLHIESVAI